MNSCICLVGILYALFFVHQMYTVNYAIWMKWFSQPKSIYSTNGTLNGAHFSDGIVHKVNEIMFMMILDLVLVKWIILKFGPFAKWWLWTGITCVPRNRLPVSMNNTYSIMIMNFPLLWLSKNKILLWRNLSLVRINGSAVPFPRQQTLNIKWIIFPHPDGELIDLAHQINCLTTVSKHQITHLHYSWFHEIKRLIV